MPCRIFVACRNADCRMRLWNRSDVRGVHWTSFMPQFERATLQLNCNAPVHEESSKHGNGVKETRMHCNSWRLFCLHCVLGRTRDGSWQDDTSRLMQSSLYVHRYCIVVSATDAKLALFRARSNLRFNLPLKITSGSSNILFFWLESQWVYFFSQIMRIIKFYSGIYKSALWVILQFLWFFTCSPIEKRPICHLASSQ